MTLSNCDAFHATRTVVSRANYRTIAPQPDSLARHPQRNKSSHPGEQKHLKLEEMTRGSTIANTSNSGLDKSLPDDRRLPMATLNGIPLLSNRGIPLNLDWVRQARVNTSAVERRAQSHVARRTVKKEWQAAWLLRALTCMDLTTLSGDDTDERVRRLCAKARQPIQAELVQRLKIEDLRIQVAAVCVYHRFVETAPAGTAGKRCASCCSRHWISRWAFATRRTHC